MPKWLCWPNGTNHKFGFQLLTGTSVTVQNITVVWNAGVSSATLTWSGDSAPTFTNASGATASYVSDAVTGLDNYTGQYVLIVKVDTHQGSNTTLGSAKLSPNLGDRYEVSASDTLVDHSADYTQIPIAQSAGVGQEYGFTAGYVIADFPGNPGLCIALIGDSRTIGTSNAADSEGPGGIFCRIHHVPCMQISLGGSGIGSILTNYGTTNGRRLIEISNCTFFNYGINDFRNQSGTIYGINYFDTVKATVEQFATDFPDNDYRHVIATVWPEDGNPGDGGPIGNDTRVAYNNRLRTALTATDPADRIEGLLEIPDFARAMEYQPDSVHLRYDGYGAYKDTIDELSDNIHALEAGDRFMMKTVSPYEILGTVSGSGPIITGMQVPASGDRIECDVADEDELRSLTLPDTITGITVSGTVSGSNTVVAALKVGRSRLAFLLSKSLWKTNTAAGTETMTLSINSSTINIVDAQGRKLEMQDVFTPNITNNSTYEGPVPAYGSPVFTENFTGSDGSAPNASNWDNTTGWTIDNNRLKASNTNAIDTDNSSGDKRVTYKFYPGTASGNTTHRVYLRRSGSNHYAIEFSAENTGGTTVYVGHLKNGSNIGSLTAFTSPATISNGIQVIAAINGSSLDLTVKNANTGATIFTFPTRTSSGGPTTGTAGFSFNDASTVVAGFFDDVVLENVITDATAPVLASAEILANGLHLLGHFTEGQTPPLLPSTAISGFSASGVTLSGSGTRCGDTGVLFKLSSLTTTAVSGITLSASSTNLADSLTNGVANFSGSSVTNNSALTADSTAPVLATPWLLPNGKDVIAQWADAAHSNPLSPDSPSGISIKMNGTNRTVNVVTKIRPDHYAFHQQYQAGSSETMTLTVSSTNLADARGNTAANITSQAITNDSLVTTENEASGNTQASFLMLGVG